MNDIRKLGSKGIGIGIGWIWLLAIILNFVDIDGWILYPIAFSGIFLMVCLTLYWILSFERFYLCIKCNEWFDKEKNKPKVDIGYSSTRYTCPDCQKILSKKTKEEKDK